MNETRPNPKFEIGDRLSGRNNPDFDYSFIVHEIEEDLETKQPVYVDENGTCFKEDQCKRTRRVRK